MPATLLMLPPQTATTREWASRVAAELPELSVVVAENPNEAARVIGADEAAFGTMPPALLGRAVGLHRPEATALVVGVGGIGAEAARLAAAFGLHVIGVDARRREAPPGVAELHDPDALDSLLPRADFVILTVPHTPATEGFMNRARFQRMKRAAFFINIGRGMTTRLDDLVAALRAGESGGARV